VAPAALLSALLGATCWAASGCAADCQEAKDLCEICEPEASGNCGRFDDASSDYCSEAVDDYEANCPEAG
jgi:hypothetical protein